MSDYPAPRRRHQRAQHAVAVGRGGAAAAALHGAGREARQRWSARSRARRITGVAIEVEGAAAAAQPEADHRRRAGRADAGLFGHGEHGQRALPGEGARARRPRGPPRPRGRLSHPGPGHRHHAGGRPRRSPAPCSATPRRGWSTCSASRSRPSSTATMIYIVNEDAPGFIGRLGTDARRGRGQHRHLPPRPARSGRRGGGPGRRSTAISPRELVAKLEALPGVKRVKPLRF